MPTSIILHVEETALVIVYHAPPAGLLDTLSVAVEALVQGRAHNAQPYRLETTLPSRAHVTRFPATRGPFRLVCPRHSAKTVGQTPTPLQAPPHARAITVTMDPRALPVRKASSAVLGQRPFALLASTAMQVRPTALFALQAPILQDKGLAPVCRAMQAPTVRRLLSRARPVVLESTAGLARRSARPVRRAHTPLPLPQLHASHATRESTARAPRQCALPVAWAPIAQGWVPRT